MPDPSPHYGGGSSLPGDSSRLCCFDATLSDFVAVMPLGLQVLPGWRFISMPPFLGQTSAQVTVSLS